jgi:hypothetical protein
MIPDEQRLAYIGQVYGLRKRLKSPEVKKTREELLDLCDQVRSEWRSRTGRLWDSQQREERLREATADQIAASGDDELIFRLVESAKSRTLLDQMGGRVKKIADAAAAKSILEQEKEMLRFAPEILNDPLMVQMRLASNLPIVSPFETASATKKIAVLEGAYAATDGGFLGTETPVTLAEVQKELEPGELLIEYWMPYRPMEGKAVCQALCITAQKLQAVTIPIGSLGDAGMQGIVWIDGRAPLEMSGAAGRVASVRTAISSGDEDGARAGLRELNDVLIAPVMEAGFDPAAFARWIIVPTGALHGLPFGALLDAGNTPLYDRVAIVMAPSSSVWQRCARRPRETARRMLAFADPAFNPAAGLPALPEAREEVRDIANLLDGMETDIYVGAEATESRFLTRGGGASILHFATHGTFPESDAIDLHRLALAAGGGQDGELRAEEIRQVDLGHTDLAVLSVCNGGIYRFGPGGELHGLAAAFLGAGARNVLATMWSIEDRAGRKFVVDFYSGLVECGPAEALRRSARELWKAGAPVAQWASFALAGDGRPLRMTG